MFLVVIPDGKKPHCEQSSQVYYNMALNKEKVEANVTYQSLCKSDDTKFGVLLHRCCLLETTAN